MKRVATLMVGLGLVLAFAAPASAVKPEIEQGHEVFTDEDQTVCGLQVDIHVDIVFIDHVFFDGEGNFERFLGNAAGTITHENAEGDQLQVSFANAFREVEQSFDPETNVLTLYGSARGMPERISLPNGPTISLDAGMIDFVTVLDFDLEDEFVSQEMVLQHGPHPEADSDFALFCEIYTDVLG